MSESVSVGLATPEAEQLANRVHVALLRRRRSSIEDVSAQIRMPPEEIAPVLDLLIGRGLVVRSRGGDYRAQPPDIALRRLASMQEQMAMRTRSMMPALVGIYDEARREGVGGEDPVVRSVGPGNDAVMAIESLIGAAHSEVWSMWRTGPTGLAMNTRTVEVGQRLQPEGLPYPPQRMIVANDHSEEARAILETRDDVTDLQIRHADTVPATAVVTDRHSVFLELMTDDGNQIQAFVSQDVALVDSTLRVIKAIWDGAETVSARPGAEVGGIDERVVSLLAAGTSDQAIARQLDVSVRTVERRVRRILDDLGASTRFAAGAEAVRRGLI